MEKARLLLGVRIERSAMMALYSTVLLCNVFKGHLLKLSIHTCCPALCGSCLYCARTYGTYVVGYSTVIISSTAARASSKPEARCFLQGGQAPGLHPHMHAQHSSTVALYSTVPMHHGGQASPAVSRLHFRSRSTNLLRCTLGGRDKDPPAGHQPTTVTVAVALPGKGRVGQGLLLQGPRQARRHPAIMGMIRNVLLLRLL